MTVTYEAIASTTLGSAASSYTFSSIPSTYTDLILIYNTQNNTSPSNVGFQFNADTASNYSSTFVKGNGSTASSGRNSNSTLGFLGVAYSTSGVFDPGIVSIQNYANATTYKSWIVRYGNAGSEGTAARVGLWRSTAAITSIKVLPDANSFSTGSTFSLYGIKAE
jgi:hypothetical protein